MILAAFTRTACNPLTCRKCYNFLLRSFVTLYRPTIFHRFPLSVPRFASVTRPPMYLNEIDDSSPSLFPLFSLCRCRFLHFFLFFFTIFFLQPFPSDFPILFFLHCHLLLSWSIISLFSPLFQLSISIPSLSLSLFPFLLLCLFPFFHSPSFPLSLFLIASSFSFHSFFLFPTLPSVNHGTFIISTLEIGEWILPLQNEDDTRQFACVINNWLKNVHKTQKHIKQKFRVEALLYLGYISLIVLLIIRIRIKIHSLITTKTRVEYTLK